MYLLIRFIKLYQYYKIVLYTIKKKYVLLISEKTWKKLTFILITTVR